MLGHIPEPELICGHHLKDILFAVGPAHAEAPLSEADLEPWERRRGIELEPWEAECIVLMSKAYMHESYLAREPSALAPWPKAVNMWRYVCDKLNGAAMQENLAAPIGDKHRGKKQRQGPR